MKKALCDSIKEDGREPVKEDRKIAILEKENTHLSAAYTGSWLL
jgi:hypothetical protein